MSHFLETVGFALTPLLIRNRNIAISMANGINKTRNPKFMRSRREKERRALDKGETYARKFSARARMGGRAKVRIREAALLAPRVNLIVLGSRVGQIAAESVLYDGHISPTRAQQLFAQGYIRTGRPGKLIEPKNLPSSDYSSSAHNDKSRETLHGIIGK